MENGNEGVKRELFLAFSTVLNTKDIFNKRYGIEDSQKFVRLFRQGILTEGEMSVRLTFSLR
jgi:hypothetical protein